MRVQSIRRLLSLVGLGAAVAFMACGSPEPQGASVTPATPAAAQSTPAVTAPDGPVVAPPKVGATAPPAQPAASDVGVAETAAEVEFEGTRLAVVHTANLIGEIEPCG